jgi:hypothetical protein
MTILVEHFTVVRLFCLVVLARFAWELAGWLIRATNRAIDRHVFGSRL